ncbi:hypothetical protein F2Q69_00012576 [Brassica cretica]|uniref:Uncharacterized protein n=1 Tax=Brassica cretica TaxID=69181 RepID=A0A8S9R116_BRACR|nr:hypothetical protein F2Q69_00012576 [Brassica cretica]
MLVFVRGVGAVCVYDHPGYEATLVKQMVDLRSCFVRAVKVHSAFPQVSSEPVAKDIVRRLKAHEERVGEETQKEDQGKLMFSNIEEHSQRGYENSRGRGR